jgi:hypothetical protein
MKSFSLLVLTMPFLALSSYAQNTFPATGNVGIGISNPSTQLYINNAFGPVLTLDKTGTQAWRLDLTHQGADLRFWNQSVGTAPLTLHSSGNVGIGTTNPGYRLDVWGGLVSSSNNGQATQALIFILPISKFLHPQWINYIIPDPIKYETIAIKVNINPI